MVNEEQQTSRRCGRTTTAPSRPITRRDRSTAATDPAAAAATPRARAPLRTDTHHVERIGEHRARERGGARFERGAEQRVAPRARRARPDAWKPLLERVLHDDRGAVLGHL